MTANADYSTSTRSSTSTAAARRHAVVSAPLRGDTLPVSWWSPLSTIMTTGHGSLVSRTTFTICSRSGRPDRRLRCSSGLERSRQLLVLIVMMVLIRRCGKVRQGSIQGRDDVSSGARYSFQNLSFVRKGPAVLTTRNIQSGDTDFLVLKNQRSLDPGR